MIRRLQQRTGALLAAMKQPGSFAQNFLVTLSGSAAVTAIGFLLTPITSRLYPPAAYGQFAVFSSVISNLAMLMTLAYQGAIPLPKTKADALALVQLCGLLAVASSALVGLVVIIAGPWLIEWLQIQAIGRWFYLLPVLLLLFNLSSMMSAWYTRVKQFRTRASVDVAASLTGRAVTLTYGWLVQGHPVGLVLGDVLSRLVTFTGLLRGGLLREWGLLRRNFAWSRLRAVAREYRDFPLYSMPSTYVGALAYQIPIFFLASRFGPAAVGFYSFSSALLEIPISLMGAALSSVFYQKAAEVHHSDPDNLGNLTLNLYNKLLYSGLLPLGIMTVYGDWIFKFVFGARWEMAGVFTGYLGYYYVFKLTAQATNSLYTILNRQRYLLLSSILLLLVRALAMAIGAYQHDIRLTLLLFGIGSLVVTFLVDMHILHLLKLPVLRIALRTIMLLVLTLLLLHATRYGLVHLLAQ